MPSMLNKFIAQSGYCSRRQAIELIKQGAVRVNGTVVTQPFHMVQETDSVKVNNKLIKQDAKVYYLFNKPKNVICTMDDPMDRASVAHFFKDVKQRLYPIGRLDLNTTGLLVMTNDGTLAQTLSHPKFNIPKTYHVTLHRDITQEDIQTLLRGIKLEDGYMKFDSIKVASSHSPNVVVVNIHSGKKHIIKRMFEAVHYFVKKLDRSGVAGLTKKGLAQGLYRTLTKTEIKSLLELNKTETKE